MGTINSSDRIAATFYSLGTLFVSGLRNICINTPHKGDSDDDDDYDNNNNNRISFRIQRWLRFFLLNHPVTNEVYAWYMLIFE
jgi:hypothetical protein